MSWIVKTFDLGCNEVVCSRHEDACEMARKIRKTGHFATVIDADAPEVRYIVSGFDVEPTNVFARSADDAVYIAKLSTGCNNYDTAWIGSQIRVVVNRPDGTIDNIECICMDEALKYMHRYNERGWRAHIQLITNTCGE